MKHKKKTKQKLKEFNVFYTPLPAEREVVVKAYSKEDAVKRVRKLLEVDLQELVETIRPGWEIL